VITKVIKGDLIKLAKQGNFDIIVHGSNCFCTMGKGIAFGIKRNFPDAYQIDKDSKKGDKDKLGTYTCAFTNYLGTVGNLLVINAYTQYDYRGEKPVDYMAIREVFTTINYDFRGDVVGIPKIGAGLAGGNWNKIKEIINEVTPDIEITLVEWDG
jgi:O-acetyl-ADP-ribose deacetylase (regulator of RNase III)